MKKDFITASPDGGTGNGTINLTADAQPVFVPRSTTLTVGATGGTPLATVAINQMPPPIYVNVGFAAPMFWEEGQDRWYVQWLVPNGFSSPTNDGTLTQNFSVQTKSVPPTTSSSIGNWRNYFNVQVLLLNSLKVGDEMEAIWVTDRNGAEYFFDNIVARGANYTAYYFNTSQDEYKTFFYIDRYSPEKQWTLNLKTQDTPLISQEVAIWNVLRVSE